MLNSRLSLLHTLLNSRPDGFHLFVVALSATYGGRLFASSMK